MPHAPERGGFPVVFLKAHVVIGEVQANRRQALQIKVLNIGGRRLQNHLQLVVLEQTVGIFAVATVGGPTRRLDIGDAVGSGPSTRRNVSGCMVPAPTSTSYGC